MEAFAVGILRLVLWFIVSFAMGAAGVWMARAYALRRHWLDHPNERSFHRHPVPRIGGLGMLLPLVVVLVALLLLPAPAATAAWLGPVIPALLIAVLSFCDDRFSVPRRLRFAGHAACALAILWVFHSTWAGAPLPVVGDNLPVLVCGLLLFLWVTGLTNSYNFMDGIDGIAGVQGLVAVAGWITVFIMETPQSPAQLILLAALAGGISGFLLLNWSPASIFMGDVGSTCLGFYLAALPFGAAAGGLTFDRALEAGFLFTWPFVIDASVTFVRRLVRRERIFEAHRSHLYQVLAATFPTREQGHRFSSCLFGMLALLGVGLYWSSGPVWAKLGVLAGVWVAVAAWTYGIRVKNSGARPTSVSTGGKVCMEDEPSNRTVAGLMPFDIYLTPPEISDVERRRVAEALASGYIAPVGPQVNAFERGLADYLGLEDMHAVNSGTAAIHLGLRALGVGPGDCVICPDLTFIASVNPARYLGAEPVLVDVDPDNWAIDPALALEAIRALKREGRTVRAMVVVHALGIPAPIEKLVAIARDEGVKVLEDCAGAFGTRVGSRCAGTFGDASAFSFNGNKVLTTSGGGALYVRDPHLREEARCWANQGKRPGAVGYHHETLGYNYKLSNICAAIGLGQLETLGGRLARKEAIYRSYRRQLSDLPQVGFMPEPAYGRNNYWLSCIRMETNRHAEEIVQALRAERIEAGPMWKPMHMQDINADLRRFGGPVSEDIHRKFISLPSGSSLTEREISRVTALVRGNLVAAR